MTNWANREKEALKAVSTRPEMKKVTGGGEGQVSVFYRFTVPTKAGGGVQLLEGNTIEGTYLGSPVSKTYDKPFHKVRTLTGEIVALPSAGQLDKAIAKIAPGTEIKVVYKGKKDITTGKYAGKAAHTFDVYSA